MQQYWSGLPFPSPADLPDPGMEPRSPALQTDTLPTEPPRKSNNLYNKGYKSAKINLKWVTDLTVKYKTTKLLEDNIRQDMDDLEYDGDFLNITLKA